ncbi:Cu and Ag efflux protein CusF [Polaromonas sp. OV174]|uniref:copper-binding protein n=1 Tax=Polaromonas sp. OV174 TaxID=1855300 RepID=UPI0008E6464E|nr:copper-binding protein [Polaromonas sp. OV174]SFC49233.1 Cu and Ag efflux protein CusF [Polaromonas sp. OV174]
MKYLTPLKASLLAVATFATLAAFAQSALPQADAEVRKVDKEAGKIALKHGEIKNLDMPPMSMVFQVKERALLDQVKVGDKVRFTADNVNGVLTVLSIEPAL